LAATNHFPKQRKKLFLRAIKSVNQKEIIMLKNILLCTDGSPFADSAGDYAIWLAEKLHARILSLYITDIRFLEGPMLADLSGAIGAQPYPALLPQLQQIQSEKADTLLGAVQQRCQEHNVSCEVAHETGPLVPTMLNYEQKSDIVVLGQRGEHAAWAGDMLGSSVERMVRASDKPCLVTPEKFRPIENILLAYDGSAESNKAIHTGIDLALALKAKASIITVTQRDHEEAASKFLQEAHQLARDHQLDAKAELLHGDGEYEILRFADSNNADLIVMGAYGHTRIRELIVGSTTSHVMRKATVPVFLSR
jgi:nucleotide-binding universal stress UspA family protein